MVGEPDNRGARRHPLFPSSSWATMVPYPQGPNQGSSAAKPIGPRPQNCPFGARSASRTAVGALLQLQSPEQDVERARNENGVITGPGGVVKGHDGRDASFFRAVGSPLTREWP